MRPDSVGAAAFGISKNESAGKLTRLRPSITVLDRVRVYVKPQRDSSLPHLIVEYSANIEDRIALDELLDKLHACALTTGVFPLGGLRVRAHRADKYRIADKASENGFVHVTAMIGHGRPLDVQQRAGEELFATLTGHLEPLYAKSPLAISLNIQEFHPVLNFKRNNLHEHVKRRGGKP
jgi:5-carboxymethyl-2-hydroxymuconate isomerase